ncbi:MAG: GNAT family N-acetyltransferase [Sciscionella sp.]
MSVAESRLGPHSAIAAQLAPATLYALLRLRVDVFVVEQRCPYPELDGRDLEPETRHLWLGAGDLPTAYLRVLREAGGVRIGRVCVARSERGRGHAKALMRAALAEVGCRECVLDAQLYAAGFYAAFGFRPEGEEFDEDGIPHIRMRRPAIPARC